MILITLHYWCISSFQFYQEELGRERLRVQQEMQVRQHVFVALNMHLCTKLPSSVLAVLSSFSKGRRHVVFIFFTSSSL